MPSTITFQDFENYTGNKSDIVLRIINGWQTGEIYTTAQMADEYDAQRNPFIRNYVKTILSMYGDPLLDFTASNNKICSNFFHRLNMQRCTYSLGNGISFVKEKTKNAFGDDIDTICKRAGYFALIHGVSFIYTGKKQYLFKATEFAPLWDEYNGTLRAGVRFWRMANDKPLTAVLYEEDGYTKFQQNKDHTKMEEVEPKKAYKVKTFTSSAFGEEVVGYDNWGGLLPIVPWFGSDLKQSTLIGMKEKIDCYDLVKSGFANDLSDIAEIYWLVENYGGMRDEDLTQFRDRIRINHIANVDTSQGGKISPYQQEIPYQARKVFLDDMRASIYEDFGALDVHTVAAGATNDHIDAAYQPMDENADDFEYQAIECIQNIGKLLGVPEKDAVPVFNRNRISNQKEQVEMVVAESQWLDQETILRKLPNVTVDEVPQILENTLKETMDRFASATPTKPQNSEELGEE